MAEVCVTDWESAPRQGARREDLQRANKRTNRATELRRIAPVKQYRGEPAILHGSEPEFFWVNPEELLVDASYQRSMSSRSHALIDKIISGWDWRRFKAPIVAEIDAGLEVIDGQHTAIAAASHPEITRIPVMRVVASDRAQRAGAFIGHNRDRIGITSMQLFHAALTAGDPIPLAAARVCERAGVRILRYPPPKGEYEVGDTLAVTALRKLLSQRGEEQTYTILRVLRDAELAPISAGALKAVEMLLYDAEFNTEISESTITAAFFNNADRYMHEAEIFSSTHRIPRWRALALMIFRARRKERAMEE